MHTFEITMIKLKPLSQNHITPFYKWINDYEVIKYSLPLFLDLIKKENIDKWYTELIENKDIINYGIFIESQVQPIGYAGICNISKINKSGEFYILIGEKDMWGKGIGTKVTELILNIGFTDINLNRIFLTVSEPNTGGINAYKNAGFKFEGKMRQACFRDNQFHDKIIMSIIKSEWIL